MSFSIKPISNELPGVSSRNHYPRIPMPEVMTTGFFTVDTNWMVTHWNKAAENLTGVKAQDMLGLNLWEAFGGAIPPQFHSAFHKVFLQELSIPAVTQWGELGEWRDVVTYLFRDRFSVSFTSNHHPVQEQTPEDRLSVINELYRCVTEVTEDCLWEWDLTTEEFFWIDGGHQRVFGYPIVNAIVPQHFWESCLHPEDKARILTRLKEVLSSGRATTWEDEYRFKKSDDQYAYVRDRAHIIYDKENEKCRMIGSTQDITARRLAEIELLETEKHLGQERLDKQKEITDAVLMAQERERAEIGKEMHDNLNQILGAAKMYIELAKTDEENRAMCLNKASEFLVTVIEAIRNISKTLTVPGKHIMGLAESIDMLLDDVVVLRPMKIEFIKKGLREESLSEKLRLDILRIVQEGMNNILKHADADTASISLTQEESKLELQIEDDGKGCKISKDTEGIGMMNIRSRVASHHGEISIASHPGKGFSLNVKLPL
jgi:PAS domain S-box-containing protein